MIQCKNCWWFVKGESVSPESKFGGQCLAYGFWIQGDSKICCDFARGRGVNDG